MTTTMNLLSLLLTSVAVRSATSISTANSATASTSSNCPPHGCSFLPVDVIFNQKARKALEAVQRDKESELDEALQHSGDENHVTLTLIGFKGGDPNKQINQDRAFIVNPFMDEANHLSGVFDGHGRLGEIVAEYAVTETPTRLAEKLNALSKISPPHDDDVVQALKDTFVQIDQDVPTQGVGGCTASVILQLGTKLYVANSGDSRSLVALYDPATKAVELVFVTREDKPHLEDERARIESMGGTVWVPPNLEQESSRVMYIDPKTGYQSGLAMSRSLGDWDMVGAIAEPLVEVIDLKQIIVEAGEQACADGDDAQECVSKEKDQKAKKSLFVVSATDGMMDYVTPQRLAEAFARAFYSPTSEHHFAMAENMIHEAAEGWDREMNGEYRDDIAVAASLLSR